MEENFDIKRVRVTKIIRETSEAKTFVLNCLDDWQPFYVSGQFITLVFFTKHGEKRRSYSISSSVELNEPLSITIKKVDNGEFSRLLTAHAKVGDILYSSGINGLFQLPKDIIAVPQYFFLAAGSGITPCYAMIRTILATGKSNVVLIYSNKKKEDTIFYEALLHLQAMHSNRFTIKFLFSNIFNVYESRLSNWLLMQLLDELMIASPEETLFYLCGPFEFMQMITITLNMSIPAKNILKENFSTLPRLIVPKPPDTGAHQVIVLINDQQYTLSVQYPKTILAVAKENKIRLPYSCEAGRCGSCVATCISGDVWMAYNEVLTDDEIEKGRVLVCQGFPVNGDVTLQF